MASSDPKQGGFTVTDRRSFTDGGQSKEAGAESAATNGGAAETSPDTPPDQRRDAAALPAVDFHTFVLSLGSSALLHLGELEPPDGGKPEKDLALAKHTIDILSMLEAKTRGNLTAAEEKLMESLLYDLRLRYVNASK
jgi:Domain of unknown function (DUF1844)